MCSILIFTKPDNEHTDPTLDWQKFKVGDVIDIHEVDKFFWGDDIQGPAALGWWKVVVLPNVQRTDVAFLLDAEVLPLVSIMGEDRSSYPHLIRLNKVDISALRDTMTRDELLAVVTAKPPLVNPTVIG